ncbi:Lrp/AsnC family transcriptional regulator [Butyrivibrio sp. AC2005]|uniref:Lrp/AsnC family transcriptional regulator n=1 Tax=Butyrivibrio sp. AC2005 TaxID=1280672 RepID=UPI00040A199E|nr:winged helix-turn-helix transcriptional regulator [Butyrivibrio sp. AC2005]
MDGTDKKILGMIKGNARMSYQEIGDRLGISRVAAKKRIVKLENEGIIRGYNTYIRRDDEITMLIDIITTSEGFERTLEYVATKTAFIRQIFTTHKENHIHMVAVSDSAHDLKYLAEMIEKDCRDDAVEIQCRQIREIIKDVYGGIRYEHRSESDDGTDC